MFYETEPELRFDEINEAIFTSQSDIGFVIHMLLHWAKHSQKNTFRIITDMPSWVWQDKSLKNEGILIQKNSMFDKADSLLLRKIGHHYWIVDGFSSLEMEELVQKLRR